MRDKPRRPDSTEIFPGITRGNNGDSILRARRSGGSAHSRAFEPDDRFSQTNIRHAKAALPGFRATARSSQQLDPAKTDYREIADEIPYRKMIYTGPIDEFFDLRFGKLPYRSLEFKHETHDREKFQPAAVVNYPNEHAYTRITEFKYLTGQDHRKTSVVYEFPQAMAIVLYDPQRRPALYKKNIATRGVYAGGRFRRRLETTRLQLDHVIARALTTAATRGIATKNNSMNCSTPKTPALGGVEFPSPGRRSILIISSGAAMVSARGTPFRRAGVRTFRFRFVGISRRFARGIDWSWT